MQPSHPTRPGAVIRLCRVAPLILVPLTTFAGKTAASADKVRGGYTPPAVADSLARTGFAGGAGLEPSCGDGPNPCAELSAITDHARCGTRCARGAGFASVDTEPFYNAQGPTRQLDGVAGNQPYIRFGNWASEQRDPGTELMRRVGYDRQRPNTTQVRCRGEHDASA